MLLYNPKTGKGINVPDIDAPGWMAIRGYTTTPPQGLQAVEQPPLFSPAVIPLPKPEAMAVEPTESTPVVTSKKTVVHRDGVEVEAVSNISQQPEPATEKDEAQKKEKRWKTEVIDFDGGKAVAGYLDGDMLTISKVHDTALISPESAVLAFINGAEKTYQLTAIPTVGHAAARSIIENRPEGGYESLDDLEGILPQRTSLSAIKAWMPNNG